MPSAGLGLFGVTKHKSITDLGMLGVTQCKVKCGFWTVWCYTTQSNACFGLFGVTQHKVQALQLVVMVAQVELTKRSIHDGKQYT